VDTEISAGNAADPSAAQPLSGAPEAAADDVEAFLGRVAILAGLGPELRAELAAHAETLHPRAGEFLFRRGDPGDGLHLVQSGRLEVVADDAGGEVMRVLRRGDWAGELALLTGAPRSASVRARRDSVVVRIGKDQFDALLNDTSFVHSLLRGLGAQLQASRGVPTASSEPPSVMAVVGAGEGAPAAEIADVLRSRIQRWSPVVVIDQPQASAGGASSVERAAHAESVDAAERAGERVLLVAERIEAGDEWARFCVEQADRVVVVTRCEGVPPELPHDVERDLLLLGLVEGSGSAQPWIAALRPRSTYRVSERDRSRDLDRVARRLSGRSIGIVLSGGGARGFAHIGALGTLAGAGIEIDRVAGCSMGAIVGGLYASGRSPEEIHALCREEFVERNPLGDYTIPVAGLVRGQRAEAMVRRMYGERGIEDFPLSFMCVTCDLISGDCIAHRSGPAYRLIGASASLPGVVPPVREEQRVLVDGGVLNNLPVEQMAAMGEGPVIAVDVTGRFHPSDQQRHGRPRARRLALAAREAVVGSGDQLPRLSETLFRSVVLGSIDTAAAAEAYADVVVEPAVAGFGITDFGGLDRLVAAGRDAANARLEEVEAIASAVGATRTAQGPSRKGVPRAHDHAA
jgi:NTE family protein